jgi:uncharacterized protein YndB with AHSA1/START domain
MLRVQDEFTVARSPEAVFDYLTDPAHLAEWQTSKTAVEPLDEGRPRQGYRVRERTKPPMGPEFEQVVEFAEFDRPRRLRTHIVDGPQPIDGTWTFAPAGEGRTRVSFVAAGELRGPLRFLTPLVAPLIRRQFAGYHANLRRYLED